MEILSTGEKIKRSRIYKGITLKELCGDKISISKMSCIENGKVRPDSDIIEYVAKKIGVDYNYLIQDVYEQITNNLNAIKKTTRKDEQFEKDIKHNLENAIRYEYYDLAFELIHIIFSYYLEEKKWEKIQLIISQYYDLFQRTNNEKNTITYFRDMAQYLFQNEEYTEAIAYYSRLREILSENGIKEKSTYAFIAYNEGICYWRVGNYVKGYEFLCEAIKYIDSIDNIINKGKIYHAYALVCIQLRYKEAEDYIEKAFVCQKDDPILVATSKGDYGGAYFKSGNRKKAVEEIEEGLALFPKDNNEMYVQFLNECINILFNNEEYEKAFDLSDEALDLAIATDNIKLIEKAYYLKGRILQKENRFRESERYMNLSLDSLFKFGSKEERYKRYLEMANMYYRLGEIRDSLKYFTLAMNVEKSM